MTDKLKNTIITNKTAVSIGLVVVLAPMLFVMGSSWSAAQATSEQNAKDIADMQLQNKSLTQEIREFRVEMSDVKSEMVRLSTLLEKQ